MTEKEREKAMDALKISAPITAMTQEEFNDYIQTLNKVMDWLGQEPRKGKWMGKGDFITCSCCNEMSYPFDSAGYGSIYHNYCPNCGADMREVRNDKRRSNKGIKRV